ncbi:MAG: amidase family protein [Kofleriaceae bacterium]
MTDAALDADLDTQARWIAAGELSAAALTEGYLARIAARDGAVGAYLAVDEPGARAAAGAIDAARARGEPLGPLAGIPLGLKDLLVTRGLATTAASRMLAGWVPPYDGTAVARLRTAGAIVLGKLNCDEFGMGSTTEHSALGTTVNPWDPGHVPGGSSGGSAAAVAAGLCSAALGTDTGGSIRQPAAHCGVVGLKPTYGRVSRYGVVAFASSLDQVGPLGRSVADCARVLEAIAGADPCDATSSPRPVPALVAACAQPATGLRIGLPREYLDAELAPALREGVERAAAALRDAGATVTEVSLPHTRHAVAAYYLIAPAEAASNLARYDGVRFGHRATLPPGAGLAELYARSRGEGFGAEVKRRIMLGTYVLRAGYYDAFYQRAQRCARASAPTSTRPSPRSTCCSRR